MGARKDGFSVQSVRSKRRVNCKQRNRLNPILTHLQGYTEGMSGHISVRDPENPHTFWTNRKRPGDRLI